MEVGKNRSPELVNLPRPSTQAKEHRFAIDAHSVEDALEVGPEAVPVPIFRAT
jgi:hypothetical protein